MPPQRRRIRSSTRRPSPPHTPPDAARHAPPSWSRIAARDHRGLRHRRRAAAAPPRSRPARSGSRAASPARPPGRGSRARRRCASAPGRRCGTSGCPPARTDRPRTAPPSAPHAPDSPAPDPHPQCTARPQHPPEQAADGRPEHRRGSSEMDDRSECLNRSRRPVDRKSDRINRGLGRAVEIECVADAKMRSAIACCKRHGEQLRRPAPDASRVIPWARVAKDGLQIRWHATDEADRDARSRFARIRRACRGCSSSMTIAAPPPTSGSNNCSIDASKADGDDERGSEVAIDAKFRCERRNLVRDIRSA